MAIEHSTTSSSQELSNNDEKLSYEHFDNKQADLNNVLSFSQFSLDGYIKYKDGGEDDDPYFSEGCFGDEMGMEDDDTMNRDDDSLSLGNNEKLYHDYYKINREATGPESIYSYLKRDGSTENLFEVDERGGNMLEDLDYVRFIPSSDMVFSKLYDHEMNLAIGMIDEVLKIRDEWVYDLPSFEEDHTMIYNYGYLHEGNSVEDIEDIKKNLPGKINIKYEMINGIYKIKWYSNHNLAYNPITFKKIVGKESKDSYEHTNDANSNVNKLFPLYETESKSIYEFTRCLRRILTMAHTPIVKSFAYYRLKFLLQSYQLYTLFNGKFENELTRNNIETGFYNVYKVDTHVHHSACMSQKHLLKYIRKCYMTDKDSIVLYNQDNVGSTLGQVFKSILGCTDQNKSTVHFNMDVIRTCFQRYDRFNEKYNLFGSNVMREIFLKYNNAIKGRYLADITKEVIQDLRATHYQYVEWRISVYGKDKNEWKSLSEWLYYNNLYCEQVRWVIQVPRIYNVLYREKHVTSFGEMLDNIFSPLIEALENPSEYPLIYILLSNIVAWDSVDDESRQRKFSSESLDFIYPEDWKVGDNPPYSYWGFYMYSNIRVINQLMYSRGLKPLKFRPHCGEAGKISHLATMYLLADSINHGILLKKTPVLQYLYYLKQIGIAVSPVSNNALFLELMKNPFPKFFSVGLNVSLSTDDPLILHLTDESLLEEYSVASHIWKLNKIDLCEIARNSVLQSGFSPKTKANWLGVRNHNNLNNSLYKILTKFRPREVNDITRTNVPNIRIQFRIDMLKGEMDLINKNAFSGSKIDNVLSVIKNFKIRDNNYEDNKKQNCNVECSSRETGGKEIAISQSNDCYN
ncbi:hypothetical protein RS030_1149 [Cryptosporidium xiaoi]|uniref:AMP deaminase n=1 Tax=Cryptosporidium xiaoi TaxID=659607 RepID=A0AAV9XYR8_9CRYT